MANPKLKTTTSNARGSTASFNMPVPTVRIAAPQVTVNAEVQIEGTEFAGAVNALSDAVRALAGQQAALLEQLTQQTAAIEQLAKDRPDINVAAPAVKLPARPSSYAVEIEDESGRTMQMRIAANSPN